LFKVKFKKKIATKFSVTASFLFIRHLGKMGKTIPEQRGTSWGPNGGCFSYSLK
jgi:hypothetical protein